MEGREKEWERDSCRGGVGILCFGFIVASARVFMHFSTQEFHILQINSGYESVLNDT